MITWKTLSYGSIVAAVMLTGGVIVYFVQEERPVSSNVTVEKVVCLIEGTLEHQASLGGATHTTNGSIAAGWGTYGATNFVGATNWSFNKYSAIPFFGSIDPLLAMRETLPQIQGMVPSFLDRVEGTNGIMLTVTGLWARLGIGDGTNKWTIGASNSVNTSVSPWTTNLVPIYADNVGSSVSTVTLNEAWAVLDACTKTWAKLTWAVSEAPEKTLVGTNMVLIEHTEGPLWWADPDPGWYTNFNVLPYFAENHVVYGMNITDSGITNYQGATHSYWPEEHVRFNGYSIAHRHIEDEDEDYWYYFYGATSNQLWRHELGRNYGYVTVPRMAADVRSDVAFIFNQNLSIYFHNDVSEGESLNYTINITNLWTSTNYIGYVDHTGVTTDEAWKVWMSEAHTFLPRLYNLINLEVYCATGFFDEWGLLNNSDTWSIEYPYIDVTLDAKNCYAIITWLYNYRGKP